MSFTSAYPPSVSTSPNRSRNSIGRKKRRTRPARNTIVAIAVFAAVSSTSAVAGLEPDPNNDQPLSGPISEMSAPDRVIDAAEARLELPPPSATTECNPAEPSTCVAVPAPPVVQPSPQPPDDNDTSCATTGDHQPVGTLATVPATDEDKTTDPNVIRFRVELEDGLAVDGQCFAKTALSILADEQGWTTTENVSFEAVDDDTYNFRLVLASPGTTDQLCRPLNTGGKFSCRNGRKVVINVMRWESGTDDYTDDLSTYRTYLINHEVGHFLGKGHIGCPAQGELAPVMMQQTKGLRGCLPNGWPTEGER